MTDTRSTEHYWP